MKITFDLQGTHGMSLFGNGIVYELDVNSEDGQDQRFALEGSLGAFRNFFALGLDLVEQAVDRGGDPSELEPVYWGPRAEEMKGL